VVEPTPLKNMLVKLDHFPRDRGENDRIFELPPPSQDHQDHQAGYSHLGISKMGEAQK